MIGWYDKRPSLWVEPVGKWGKGAINLMEIPTTGETLDNVRYPAFHPWSGSPSG